MNIVLPHDYSTLFILFMNSLGRRVRRPLLRIFGPKGASASEYEMAVGGGAEFLPARGFLVKPRKYLLEVRDLQRAAGLGLAQSVWAAFRVFVRAAVLGVEVKHLYARGGARR